MNGFITENEYQRMKECERVSEMSDARVVMEYRTSFFSEKLWRKLSENTKKELLSLRPKKFFIGRYVANIVDDLQFVPDEEKRKIISAIADAIYDLVCSE